MPVTGGVTREFKGNSEFLPNNCWHGTAVLPQSASVPGVPVKAERTTAGGIAGHLVHLLLPSQEQEFELGLGGSILHPPPRELGEVPVLHRVERCRRSPRRHRSAAALSPGAVTTGAGSFPASLKGSSAHEMFSQRLKMLKRVPFLKKFRADSRVLPISSQEEQMTQNQTAELQLKIGL